jgi:polyisoprenyl-phosphate glycosyltransferase
MLLSIIVPVYNEAESLPLLMERLSPVLAALGCDYEIVFVNDGSSDRSRQILTDFSLTDARVKVIEFSRNFGHQAAITAGLDFVSGDATVIMDADLQDPPELLPEMMRLLRQGYEVVSAQRQARRGESLSKRATAAGFYWFMRRFVERRIQPEVGDFRMFSKAAVLALRQFREQHRFMRGLVAWLGLKEVIVPFERESRANGVTKYPLLKMMQLDWTAVTSFSAFPLRLSVAFGFLFMLFGLGYLLYAVCEAVIAHAAVPGWTSLVCLQVTFSGAILMALGLVGSYVARIYEEAKQRPLYVVSGTANVPLATAPPRSVVLATSPSAGATESSPLVLVRPRAAG